MGLSSPPFHLPSLDSQRNIYVGEGTFETLADAVAYAETLDESVESDPIGVMVHLPVGEFDEDIVIRRNVHIKGVGRAITRVSSVTYRPTSDELAPMFCRLIDLQVTTLTVSNETEDSSAVFNPDGLFNSDGIQDALKVGLKVSGCVVRAWDMRGAWWCFFDSCDLGDEQLNGTNTMVSVNVNHIAIKNCSFYSDIIHTLDCSLAGAIYYILDEEDPENSKGLDGTLRVEECSSFATATLRTEPIGADFWYYSAVLVSTFAFFAAIDLGPLCVGGMRATGYFSITIDPTASITQTVSLGYTPASADNWSAGQHTADTALDELADARSKARNIGALGNFPSGGSIGAAAETVDIYGLINISQTTLLQTLTLPSPTDTAHTRMIVISNTGNMAFTMLGALIGAGTARAASWTGSGWELL